MKTGDIGEMGLFLGKGRWAQAFVVMAGVGVLAITLHRSSANMAVQPTITNDTILVSIIEGRQLMETLVPAARGVLQITEFHSQDPEVLAGYTHPYTKNSWPKDEKTVRLVSWRFDAPRYYEDSVVIQPAQPSKGEAHEVRAFDGNQANYYGFHDHVCERLTSAQVAQGQRLENHVAGLVQAGCWVDLQHHYGRWPDADGACGQPAVSARLVNEDAKYVGQETVNGKVCKVLEGHLGRATTKWWIAGEDGYIVMKHTDSWHQPSGNTLVYSTETKTVKAYNGGIVLPASVEQRCVVTLPSGRQIVPSTISVDVKELEVAPVLTQNDFQFADAAAFKVIGSVE